MAPKRGKLLWAGGTSCAVNEELDTYEGFKLVTAANSDGETFTCVLDPEGRKVGEGKTGDSALADALKKGYLRTGHDKTVKAWKKKDA